MSNPERLGRHVRRRPTRKDFTQWGAFICVVFIVVIVAAVLIFGDFAG